MDEEYEPLVCCLNGIWVHPPYHSTGQVRPRFVNSWSLMESEWKWCHYIMFDADIHLRPLPISILDIQRVWAHWCAVHRHMVAALHHSTGQVGPRLGIRGHMVSQNDVIMSWLRLPSYSNCFPHPYKICTKCLSLCYAVSRAYGCTLVSFHWSSWPKIWEFWVAYGVDMMSLHHGWGCHPIQSASHIHIRYVQSVWAFVMLSQGHMGAPLHHSTGQVGLRFVNPGSLLQWKWW